MGWFKNLVIGAAVGAALVTSATAASDYPNRTITLILPFAPGGASDASMRVFTRVLSQNLGQPVIIDNKPGAGGIVGMEAGAAAKPDGYTLLFASTGPLAIFSSLYKKLSYDPVKSFTGVRFGAENPYILVLNPSKPFKTVAELIDYAKKNPDKLNYGSVGNGGTGHLATELFQSITGTKMTHVPYKLSTALHTDLMAGTLDFAFELPNAVRPHVESGKLVAVAVANDTRMKNFPDVPTFAELGFPQIKIGAWSSFLVPAGTPEPIVQKLDEAIAKVLKDPAMQQIYSFGDSLVLDIDRKQFPVFLASETARFKTLVEKAGVSLD